MPAVDRFLYMSFVLYDKKCRATAAALQDVQVPMRPYPDMSFQVQIGIVLVAVRMRCNHTK